MSWADWIILGTALAGLGGAFWLLFTLLRDALRWHP